MSEPMPHEQLIQVMMGMWAAQATGVFARFKIADAIAGGATTSAAIAEKIGGASVDGVHRLVRACGTVGLVTGTDPYALTPMGELLRSDAPISFRALLDAEMAPGHWLPWGHLDACIKAGKSQAEAVLGMKVWDYYAKNHEEGHAFSQAMTGLSGMAIMGVAAAYTYPPAKRVVDVGGAHGALLASVLQAQPDAKGVLFDLPHVVEKAGSTLRDAKVQDRVELVGGDFMKEVPAGDLYLMKFIIHDWDDASCLAILKNVRKAMAPGGKLVVIEMIIPDDGSPSPSKLSDLNMLVMMPGRERTASEMKALLASAGFGESRIIATPSPFSVIEAS